MNEENPPPSYHEVCDASYHQQVTPTKRPEFYELKVDPPLQKDKYACDDDGTRRHHRCCRVFCCV